MSEEVEHPHPPERPFALAGRPPSAQVLAELEVLDTAVCGDGELVEAIAAWQAMVSRTQVGLWESLRALAERRPRTTPQTDPGASWDRRVSAHASSEIAAALNLPLSTVDGLAGDAVSLLRCYPALLESLKAGRINRSRLNIFTRSLDQASPEVRDAIVKELLPDAESALPNGALRNRIRRALIVADPDLAARRAETAARTQTQVVLYPREDAMASLVATAPAVDLVAVHAAVDAFARGLRQAGAPGRLDGLRARSLQELVLTHPAITGLGVWQQALASQPGPNAGSCATAPSASLDSPAAEGGSAEEGAVGDAASASAAGANRGLGALGGLDDEGRLALGMPLSEIPTLGFGSAGRFASLTLVAIPYDVLLGESEAPGELAGYGPVPAPLARAIAADPTGTWQRLVTDPLSGSVQDFGTTRYRPPAKLAGHVIARDWTCRAPGCSAPAAICDIDHVTPYRNDGTGGRTCSTNLIPLCRRHHRSKTFTAWSVTRDPNGVVHWVSPTGHRYRIEPDGPNRREEI